MYWARSFRHDWRDLRACAAHRTHDGGILVAGSVDASTLHQLNDRLFLPGQFLVTKLDSQGAVEWERAWPAVPFWWAGALCAAETEDGGFVIAGYRLVENVGRLETPVVKFDAQGGLVWQQILRRKDQHACIHSMTAAPDNGLMLAGYIKPVQAQAGSEQDIWLLRLNAADGSIVWQRSYDFGFNELAVAIRPSGHERFAVAGNILSPIQYPQPNPSPIFALEVDGGGSLLAQRAFLLPDGIATATSITVAHQDGLVLAGSFGLGKDDSSAFALSFSPAGADFYDWAFLYEVYFQEPRRLAYGEAICETADGQLALAGSCSTGLYWYSPIGGLSFSPAYGYLKHGLLLKLRGDGVPLFCRLYGGDDVDVFSSAEAFGTPAHQPGILVAGTTESFPPLQTPPAVSGERMWVMALDLDGSTQHNMACMLHEAPVEYKTPEVQDPGCQAEEREAAILRQETDLAEAELCTLPLKICP